MKEIETIELVQPENSEIELVNTLKEKDKSIVALEMKDKEKEKLNTILCQNIKSLERRIQKFDKVTKVKDLAIIKLSDAINEYDSETIGDEVPFQYENVSVGSQTEEEDSKETLQDTAKAFLMQNKYLNKEVLELNQLRQQAWFDLFYEENGSLLNYTE